MFIQTTGSPLSARTESYICYQNYNIYVKTSNVTFLHFKFYFLTIFFKKDLKSL